MFNFLKTKKNVDPERIYIPEEHIEELAKLRDAFNAVQNGIDNFAHLQLWRFIKEATKIDVSKGDWKLGGSSLRPYIFNVPYKTKG